ncbi:hypothetical protein U1Q18_008768 [Sarracenia purpurea var. burkii]
MSREVTNEEIRDVMWSLPRNKAPGPDGYSAGVEFAAAPVCPAAFLFLVADLAASCCRWFGWVFAGFALLLSGHSSLLLLLLWGAVLRLGLGGCLAAVPKDPAVCLGSHIPKGRSGFSLLLFAGFVSVGNCFGFFLVPKVA